jgi:hypothetical protein
MISTAADAANVIKEFPAQVGRWVSGGNPLAEKVITSMLEKGFLWRGA